MKKLMVTITMLTSILASSTFAGSLKSQFYLKNFTRNTPIIIGTQGWGNITVLPGETKEFGQALAVQASGKKYREKFSLDLEGKDFFYFQVNVNFDGLGIAKEVSFTDPSEREGTPMATSRGRFKFKYYGNNFLFFEDAILEVYDR